MHARMRKAMASRDQGFTLIELLVVMIIIGVLAAIAIPVFLNQRKKAVDASLTSDVKAMATAQETYIVDNPTAMGLGYDGAAATPAAVPATLSSFRASDGNKILVTVNATNGYCIKAWNAAGTKTTQATAVTYDSAAGGLNKSGGAC